MAQTNFTPISLYYSATATNVPSAANLVAGELAINTADGKLFYKDSAGVVQVIGTKGGVGSSTTTQVLYNSSGLVVGSANLTFNGTTLTAGGLTTTGATSTGTFSATGVATFSAGTVSAPAITTTGDTNTGIFFPAADTIAFTEGGVESMRIDSSGNVGIATSSPGAKFGVLSTGEIAKFITSTARGGGLGWISFYDPTGRKAYVGYASGTSDNFFINNNLNASILFSTNDTEAMRIDSSGNVGIGTSNPTAKLDVRSAIGNIYVNSTTGTNQAFFQANNTGGDFYFAIDNSTGGNFNTGTAYAGVIWRSGTNPICFVNNNTERMRITSDGNVGIGTSSPDVKLHVDGTGTQYLKLSSSTNSNFIQTFATSGSTGHEYKSVYRLVDTDAGERMRIDSSGNLLVGRTTASGDLLDVFNGSSSSSVMRLRNDLGGGQVFARFDYGGGVIGSITGNNSATAYNTSSDYRLKENIAPMIGALAAVAKLKPVTYDWKAGGSSQGFIAHELAEVVPDCVTGEKDAINEDGSIKAQGIDTSFLVATLTAAIQEQQTLINNLTTRLNALEGK